MATKEFYNPTSHWVTDRKESRTTNTGLAKVALQYSADTFVVNQSLVLRINICGENRHLRKAANRYSQLLDEELASGLGTTNNFKLRLRKK
jgi:hypothetical protein